MDKWEISKLAGPSGPKLYDHLEPRGPAVAGVAACVPASMRQKIKCPPGFPVGPPKITPNTKIAVNAIFVE